jgi:hypothetical protein
MELGGYKQKAPFPEQERGFEVDRKSNHHIRRPASVKVKSQKAGESGRLGESRNKQEHAPLSLVHNAQPEVHYTGRDDPVGWVANPTDASRGEKTKRYLDHEVESRTLPQEQKSVEQALKRS